jgi:hypothetical protein
LRHRIARTLAMTVVLGLVQSSRAGAQISPGPLAKAHASLEGAANCAQCHGLRREPMTQVCLSCHKDIQWMLDQRRGLHAREVTAGKKECASCHPDHAGADFSLVAWTEGSSARFDHRRTGWPLDAKHSEAKCEKCHTAALRTSPAAALSKRKAGAGWLGLETTCASCHRDDDVHRGSLGATCESCHDAKGWKTAAKFDHARTSYPLTGKHDDVACDKCHLAARLGVKAGADGKRMPQFKPVPFKECSSCHDDPHKGRLSAKCSDCHVTRGFGIVDRKDFDHARTRYALDGKHRTVNCEACHGVRMARPNPAFATCASCHADAHRGEATLSGKAVDCAACHRVEGFAPSTFTAADHQRSGYPLSGKHLAVKCDKCHAVATPGVVAKPVAGKRAAGERATQARIVPIRVAHAQCGSCHSDAHGGQRNARADKGTCEGCHTDAGWTPSTFTAAQHAGLKVPLDGRHATAACAACHGTVRPGLPVVARAESFGSARVVLAVAETECASCHVDAHAGRYAKGGAKPMIAGCPACHDTHAFRPSTLDVATHARFSFSLDGAHRAAPCVACHVEMKGRPATSTLVGAVQAMPALPFTASRATTCQSCHDTPHGDQFAQRADGGRCESCHGVEAFAPATRFNHDRDGGFALAGAHAKVACASCHKPATKAGTKPSVMYRGVSRTCESCHAGRPLGRNQ